MKFFFLSVVIFWIMFHPVFSSTDISSITQKYGVSSTQMYKQVFLQDALKDFKKICTKESIAQWENSFINLKRKFDSTYTRLQDYKKLAFSKKEFEKYQKKMLYLWWTSNIRKCTHAIAWSNYMDYLRDIHISLLHSSWIIKDFDTINSTQLYGWDIKIGLLQELAQGLQKYDTLFPLYFITKNEKLIGNLESKEKKISDLLALLLKRTIQKKLFDLRHNGLLTDWDIQQFQWKIVLEWTNSCSNFHGVYKMKEVYTSDGMLVSQEVDQMKILLNLCYNYHTLQDIGKIFEKMVVHEIGHHLYYQKDKTRKVFESICRDTTTTKKKMCQENSFVSPYAMTNALEDYAEQFMYTYLKIPQSGDVFLTKKNSYFQNISTSIISPWQ